MGAEFGDPTAGHPQRRSGPGRKEAGAILPWNVVCVAPLCLGLQLPTAGRMEMKSEVRVRCLEKKQRSVWKPVSAFLGAIALEHYC